MSSATTQALSQPFLPTPSGRARGTVNFAGRPSHLGKINFGLSPVVPYLIVDSCATSTPLQLQAQRLVKQVLGGD